MFGIYSISYGEIMFTSLMNSLGREEEQTVNFRPVVILKDNLTVKKGNGDINNPYELDI